MRTLASLQREFIEAVLGDATPHGLQPPDATAFYRRSVRANQAAALRATYPVIARLVGDAFFDECAARYAMAYPSTSGDLHRFGGHLAAFLAGYEPARTAPYAADVARLEWAVHECAQAAGVPAFDFAALARVAPERHAALRVRVAPAVRWLSSDHPVASIWEANQPGRDGTPAPAQGGEHVLAWRAAATVRVQRIDAAAHRLLDAFATGASVLEAAESLGDAAACLPALLPRWCADGVIASIDLPA